MKQEGVLAQHRAGGRKEGKEVKRDGSICLDVKRCHVIN